ncbi:MAG: DUF6438 domain-containing protein [Saprospiraceae bacterium]
MKLPYSLFALVLLVASCEPPDPYLYDATATIELKKDPCFGFCPVYSIKIDGKGNATYDGQKNVEKVGTWYQTLSPEETNDLFDAFENADFWQFENEYTAQVTDLPTTWVTFILDEKNKTIKDYYGAPEGLKKLESMVEAIVENEENWSQDVGE